MLLLPSRSDAAMKDCTIGPTGTPPAPPTFSRVASGCESPASFTSLPSNSSSSSNVVSPISDGSTSSESDAPACSIAAAAAAAAAAESVSDSVLTLMIAAAFEVATAESRAAALADLRFVAGRLRSGWRRVPLIEAHTATWLWIPH